MIQEEYYQLFSFIRVMGVDPKQVMEIFGRRLPFVLNYKSIRTIKKGGYSLQQMGDILGMSRDELIELLYTYIPKTRKDKKYIKSRFWKEYEDWLSTKICS